MSRDKQSVRRAEDRADRGSVLIFVVGVLLLLSIIATAFLGTTRADRTATQQHAYNTQIDLLLEGVVNAMKGAILSDARVSEGANGYDSASAFTATEADTFIAARVPGLLNNALAVNATTNPPVWPTITGPLLDTAFSYPFAPSVVGNAPATYTMRSAVVPTVVTPSAGPYSGRGQPAFQFDVDEDLSNGYTPSLIVPAIDADGDGVADAGMVRLPIGPLAGVTYYYGARIVDLNSAINVNTAWISNNPTAAVAAPQYNLGANFFPSNLDLQNLLVGTASGRQGQMDLLNVYRTNLATGTFNLTPVGDNRVARPDFTFAGTNTTSTDALWNQLGRRPVNPGINTLGASAAADVLYKPFTVNAATRLFSRFIIRDPSDSDTELDTRLTASVKTAAPVTAYTPQTAADVATWFTNNFAYPQSTTTPQADPTMPVRALLTTTNAVASDNPGTSRAVTVGWIAGNTYGFGEIVSFAPTPGGTSRNFVCLASNVAALTNSPGTIDGLQFWGLLGWSVQSQKIDVNVADFGELWWGFRRLMAAGLDTTLGIAPNVPSDPTLYTATTKARQFRNPIRDPAAVPQFPAQPGERLTPSEVLQLRTALAAVNAMDIRDSDTNVTGRQITTYDFTTTPPTPLHVISVFGSEMQPYITEVYYNNDNVNPGTVGAGGGPNPAGYVAIELYNPYPVDINLGNWSIGLIDRAAASTYPKTITPVLVTPFVGEQFAQADNVIVPAGGHLVLENFNSAGVPVDAASDALHRPDEVTFPLNAKEASTFTASAGPNEMVYKYMPQLARFINGSTPGGVASTGGELVLLRPRQWTPDGAPSALTVSAVGSAAAAEDPHNEGVVGTLNLSDWIPVDSFDFTGMTVAAASAPTFSAWHYVRAHDAGANSWKCTHGGPYVPGAGTLHQGEVATFPATTPPAAGTPPPFLSTAVLALGAYDSTRASFLDTFTGTQINAPDWPTPMRATTAGGAINNQTPFGAFRLQTDLLKIPFVGAYTVRAVGYTAGEFTEMNALPMDWSFADDQDDDVAIPDPPPLPVGLNNNTFEQVGRFCQLSTLNPIEYRNWPNPATPPYTAGTPSPTDWYDFAYSSPSAADRSRTIFDIFTTQSPMSEMLPAVSADAYAAAIMVNPDVEPTTAMLGNSKKAPGVTYSTAQTIAGAQVTGRANLSVVGDYYQEAILQVLSGDARGAMATIVASSPTRILSLSSTIPGFATGDAFRILGTPNETTGTEGLVNINTAPWPVLARLPFAFTAAGAVDPVASEIIARRIVEFRDGNASSATAGAAGVDERTPHGPFKSILDLNKVLSADQTIAYFQTAAGQAMPLNMAADQTNLEGDLTPLGGADGVIGDFETRYLALSRISNMITTRSDAFVVYVVLQGWRDAGTANAALVTQRRAAYLIDRSGATTKAPTLQSTRVPVN